MTGYDCFFIGGPHHNSMMHVRSDAKPSSSWGSLVPNITDPPTRHGPAFITYGIYTHEATIEGYDHGIATGVEARPLAIYVWRGDGKQTERP